MPTAIGDIADVSYTSVSDPSQAQMLARRGHPKGTVASVSGVSNSVAHYYVRRNE